MIRELSVQEQKYQAVLAALVDGVSVSEVAQRWGVSRQSVHAWLRRYEDEGLAGLEPRSSRPASCPHQVDGVVEARILELRRVIRGGVPGGSSMSWARQPTPANWGCAGAVPRRRIATVG